MRLAATRDASGWIGSDRLARLGAGPAFNPQYVFKGMKTVTLLLTTSAIAGEGILSVQDHTRAGKSGTLLQTNNPRRKNLRAPHPTRYQAGTTRSYGQAPHCEPPMSSELPSSTWYPSRARLHVSPPWLPCSRCSARHCSLRSGRDGMGGFYAEKEWRRRSVGASIIIFATIKPGGCPRIPSVCLPPLAYLAPHDGSGYVAVQGRIVRLGIPNYELSLLRPGFVKGPQHECVKPLNVIFLSPARQVTTEILLATFPSFRI